MLEEDILPSPDEVISTLKLIKKHFNDYCWQDEHNKKNKILDASNILVSHLINHSGFHSNGKDHSNDLRIIFNTALSDATFMFNEDPAAVSIKEIILCYPGFTAVLYYRLAHFLFQHNMQLIPRMITEIAHSITGIDIHPGAKIDAPFMIDHGTGVVIGETTIIGHHVKIYQGVTLGANAVRKEDNHVKRHPTIEDYVTIYAGSTILGGRTTIGHNSIIGGNTWITQSVKPYSVVFHRQQNVIKNMISNYEYDRNEPTNGISDGIHFVI